MASGVAIPVTEPSQVAEARRAAAAVARGLHFDDTAGGSLAIVVTELAKNLLKHASGGEILVHPASDATGDIDVLALDKGPGIADVDRCLSDGYSTAGTAGTGLGSVGRLSVLLDVYSAPGIGTAVLSRVRPRTARPAPVHALATGVVCLPQRGELECGDAWATVSRERDATVLVCDGVGHGPSAALASRAAVGVFGEHGRVGPAETLGLIHAALRATRGAAAAIAHVDVAGGIVCYAGVGNVCGAILDGRIRQMVSHNGTLGHQAPKIVEFTYPWSADALLVMHSDGLVSHWSLDRYPGLRMRDPSLIAGVLYRDFTRNRDDVTVLVARAASGGAR